MDFPTIVLCRDGRQLDLGRIHRCDHDCGSATGRELARPAGTDPEATKILCRMIDFLSSQTQFSVDTRNTIEVVFTSVQKIQFDHGGR